jgi:hypothetical protein
MDRRAFLQASVAAALMSRWAGVHADDLAAYKPAVPGRPAPKPSRCGKTSTAEDVTAGMDLSGKTALVTAAIPASASKRCACLELSVVFASSN